MSYIFCRGREGGREDGAHLRRCLPSRYARGEVVLIIKINIVNLITLQFPPAESALVEAMAGKFVHPLIDNPAFNSALLGYLRRQLSHPTASSAPRTV